MGNDNGRHPIIGDPEAHARAYQEEPDALDPERARARSHPAAEDDLPPVGRLLRLALASALRKLADKVSG